MHGLASSAFRRACVASSSVRRLRAKTARGARGVFSRATPVVRAMAAPSTSAPLSGDAQVAYDALTSRLKKLSALDAIEATIQWDELVMMPESAAEARGNQKAVLAELKHLEATSEAHAAAKSLILSPDAVPAMVHHGPKVVRTSCGVFRQPICRLERSRNPADRKAHPLDQLPPLLALVEHF